jgi:glucan-binding YG repeat protein
MKRSSKFRALALSLTVAMLAGVCPAATRADEQNGWVTIDGKDYWYENGVRQGYDATNPAYRGKEIYDPGSDAWYWLDNVQQGAKATGKDVFQESDGGAWSEGPNGTGKWVRYDADGHMVKGWDTVNGNNYYFDLTYGTMAKGVVTIDGQVYWFNQTTGIGETGWLKLDGKDYWYENGIRQGYDPSNPAYRGKEIYDPGSNAWYWLDNVQQGAKATSKDVFQESDAGPWAELPSGKGKWVRYDADGHMVKGWNTQNGKKYYFEPTYGTMAKGRHTIDGNEYFFDAATGVVIEENGAVPAGKGWKTINGKTYYYINGERQGEKVGGEIYDEGTKAYYYLDNSQGGARLENKDVKLGDNYWVRYGADGKRLSGWVDRDGKSYYYDEKTGNLAKGIVTVNGVEYYFDETTGALVGNYNGNNQGMIWAKSSEKRYSKSGAQIGVVQFSYTDKGKIQARTEWNAVNKVVLKEIYTYDATTGELTKYEYQDKLDSTKSRIYEYSYDETSGKVTKEVRKKGDGTVIDVIKYKYQSGKTSTADVVDAADKKLGSILYTTVGTKTTARYYNANGQEQYSIETETTTSGGKELVKSEKKISKDRNVGVMEGVEYEYKDGIISRETILGTKGVVVEDTKYDDFTFPTPSLMATKEVESTTYNASGAVIRTTKNTYTVIQAE